MSEREILIFVHITDYNTL